MAQGCIGPLADPDEKPETPSLGRGVFLTPFSTAAE
jgi:hypothetical protein